MSGSVVGFTYTPPNLRIPLTAFEITSNGGTGQTQQRALLIGASDRPQPVAIQECFSPGYAANTFGPASMLARMMTKYALNDAYGEVWALPLNPASTAAASLTVTYVGAATTAGLIAIYIGDQRVPVAVNVGDGAAAVAMNVQLAVNAVQTIPGTFGPGGIVNGQVVDIFTFDATLGASANLISFAVNLGGPANGEVLPAGLTIAVAQGTAGAGVVSMPDLRPLLGDGNFDAVISGYTDATSLGVITELLSDASGRWSPASMQYGHAFGAVVDTLANLTQDGASWNDQHRTIFGLVGSPTPPWEAAAAIVGAVYPSLKADPLRPLQTLPVLGVMAPPASTAPVTVANKQALLSDGVAMVQWDQSGNCTVLRAVTTYQKNAYGVADTNYLDTETLFGLMTFVRRLNAAYTNTYPRSKLADNGTHFGAGVSIVTPNDIRNVLVAEYAAMETEGLVEDTADFAAGLVVVRNSQDPSRVDVLLDPILVSGLRLIANVVKFGLLPPVLVATS